MGWELLIIPLIGVAVWVLSSIFRGLEERKARDRPARGPDEAGRGSAPRRPTAELDRFLDEARRRREVTTSRRQPAEELPRAEPVAMPAPPKPRERSAPKPRERPVAKPAARRGDPTAALPVAMPVVLEVAQPALPTALLPPPQAPPAPPRKPSPVLGRLQEALLDRNAMMTALVLTEVLGRPVSARRR